MPPAVPLRAPPPASSPSLSFRTGRASTRTGLRLLQDRDRERTTGGMLMRRAIDHGAGATGGQSVKRADTGARGTGLSARRDDPRDAPGARGLPDAVP